MVITSKLLPSPQWQPFIKWFALREFEATLSAPLVRPLPAMSDFLIAFNLNNSPSEHKGHPADEAKPDAVRKMKSISWVTGVFDQFMGSLSLAGKRRDFTIEFTASGFYNIFGWPARHFTSNALTGGEVFGNTVALLEEQLCEATNLQEMARISEAFLKTYLHQQKPKEDTKAIRVISLFLENATATVPVERLASMACMSLKSFERKFTEQVGVGPKYFSRILRFNQALRLKMQQPHQSWTSVAYTSGYFDQMHFIKDFKQFTGMSPTAFLQHLPPPTEVMNHADGEVANRKAR